MSRNVAGLVMVFILTAAIGFPAFPLAGLGIHYGYDLSLSMPDKLHEQASLGKLTLPTSSFSGSAPSGFPTSLTGADLPLYIDRTDFKSHWFNLGGKIYIDFIPFINCIELSANYGMSEYRGRVIYPTGIDFDAGKAGTDITEVATITYDTTDVTLEALDISNPFIKNTPYARLQFDLTVRKYIIQFPPFVKILKLYGGGGLSTFFATPVLSASFIDDAIGSSLSSIDDLSKLGKTFDQDSDVMQKLGKEFLKRLFTPHYGMHLDLGVMVKIPIMPLGVYIDGKYLIPFGKMDAGADLKGTGLLINGGVAFAL